MRSNDGHSGTMAHYQLTTTLSAILSKNIVGTGTSAPVDIGLKTITAVSCDSVTKNRFMVIHELFCSIEGPRKQFV